MATAAKKIVEVLIEAGIDHVFGLPGGNMMRIWEALRDHQDKIRTVLTRDEQTASCMADMYGRLTGKPGVFVAQGCFACTTGLFGVLEAYLGSSPMVVLTDISDHGGPIHHAPIQCGGGEYGNFDIAGIFRSSTKYTTVAHTPVEAVQGVQFALKHAVSGRPGPGACIMTTGAVTGELDPDPYPRIYHTSYYVNGSKPAADPHEVKRAVRLLLEAERPVVIAGNGVHAAKSYAELQELAELLAMPVATTWQGKSAFPESHPLAIGFMGTFGERVGNQEVNKADVLVVVGSTMSPLDTCSENPELIDPARQKIIQVEIDPRNAGWIFPIEVGLIGDAKIVLTQLLEALGGEKIDQPPYMEQPRIRKLQQEKELDFVNSPACHDDRQPILRERVVYELSETLPPEAIIAADAGNNLAALTRFFKTKNPGSYFCPLGIAGMSWSLPAALTAKLLYPDRPCVAVCSDGFAMQNHVLATALQYHAAVIFVIQDDYRLGMVHEIQGDRAFATDYLPTDWAAVAEAHGCRGIRVERARDLQPALNRALKNDVPTVIEVMIDRDAKLFTNLRHPWAWAYGGTRAQ